MISIIVISKEVYKPFSKNKDLIKEFAKQQGVKTSFIRNLFTIYVAEFIVAKIKRAVKTQKIQNKPMKRVYKPLSKSYRKSKPYGTKTKFWINSNQLVKKLGVYITPDDIVHVGFRGNPRYLNNKNKVEFKKVLKYMEYGTKNKDGTRKMPPRPLIRPVLKVTRKNVSRLWTNFKNSLYPL